MKPNATLRFMAEWPPHAIAKDEREALLAGAEALEDAVRRATELQIARELLDEVGMGHLLADAIEQWAACGGQTDQNRGEYSQLKESNRRLLDALREIHPPHHDVEGCRSCGVIRRATDPRDADRDRGGHP